MNNLDTCPVCAQPTWYNTQPEPDGPRYLTCSTCGHSEPITDDTPDTTDDNTPTVNPHRALLTTKCPACGRHITLTLAHE